MPYLIPLLGPLGLGLAAWLAFQDKETRPALVAWQGEVAALVAVAVALLSLTLLLATGPGTAPGLLGLAPRIDPLSVTMLLLVSSIGWVVLRYAGSYLRGEPGQGRFTGWLCLTLAAVLLFVQAGHLVQLVAAWIGTSLALHKLLLFYPARPLAQRAAAKRFVTARAGDAALIGAAGLMIWSFGTGDIAAILSQAQTATGSMATHWAAGLLALAALLKSAQFPTHGWLTEVMETPTPVSALLHAGVINAGGVLLIRFADVMLLAPGVLAALVMIGGFTALFGGLVMLTQPAVKTALAWSTVAQMGFMILQCGLALFPLALLHIVAHSVYKAHAFLSSGGAVLAVAATRRPGPIAIPDARAVGRAFLLALAIYAVGALAFGLGGKSTQAILLGAILIFGVAYLMAQGLAEAAPRALTQRTILASLVATTAYFSLQWLAITLMAVSLPAPPPPGPLEWTLMILALVSFGGVAIAQAMFPLWSHHPAAGPLRVHLSNGLYANAMFDRILGAWAPQKEALK